MTSPRVTELLVEGRLEKVPRNKTQSGRLLQAAARHVESARLRAADDPSGSYTLLYDAARKAVAAHMLAHGLRVTNRPGAHAAVVTYAESELVSLVGNDVDNLDRMRRSRHDTEYDARPISADEVRHDLVHAEAIVRAVGRALFPPRKRD